MGNYKAKNAANSFTGKIQNILNQSNADNETKELVKNLAIEIQNALKEIADSIE